MLVLDDLREQFPESIAVVFRHYPNGTNSLNAARSAICASQMDRFAAVHSLMYSNIEAVASTDWHWLAEQAGVPDPEAFVRCVQSADISAVIEKDIDAADAFGMGLVPLILVNQHLFSGYPGHTQLKRYVATALRQAVDSR